MKKGTSDWMAALEAKVQEAADALRKLNADNALLQKRIDELEKQVSSAQQEGAAAWEEERDEIRRRVEALVEKLEGLADS
jgi:chromosome segregation ATPase